MSRQRARRTATALASAALIALGASAAGAAEPPQPEGPAPVASAPDRVIVVYEPGTSSSDRAEAREDADTALVRTLGKVRFQLVVPETGQSVADAIDALRDDPSVRIAVRDGYSDLHATTNDPLFTQLWGLQNLGVPVYGAGAALGDADVDAQRAWNRTRGVASVVLADIDAGYRFDHPDLAPVAWSNPLDPPGGGDNDANGIVDDSRGADFVGNSSQSPTTDGDPTDDNLISGGHGVHTAGTMAAAGNNGVGISGVAQNVRIMPLRVCAHDTSDGQAHCPNSSLIAAINYAGSHGARAANMSLGSTTGSTAVRDAMAANPRTLYVISAGNDTEDNEVVPHYPCVYDPSTSGVPGAIDNVICVAATDQADGLADFSDWGATTVDLAAPGTETLSTYMYDLLVDDTFAVDDFAAKWSPTGTDGGFARTNESPLTSFGISDSPGATPTANAVRQSTSAAATMPPSGGCKIVQTRRVVLGATGSYRYEVLLNGRTVAGAGSSPANTAGGGLENRFLDLPAAFNAGGSVQVQVTFRSGAAPSAGSGVWLDNIRVSCAEPVGQTDSYGFLDGTSMATPHVTGAAGLLFSLSPSATVAQVKRALLTSVDPVPALAGLTVTGGRLNVADALEALVPTGQGPPAPDTAIVSGPVGTTTSTTASFVFARTDELDLPTFECQLDGGAFAPCGGSAQFAVGLGAHTLAVRAKDEFLTVDPTPATASWTVVAPALPALPPLPPRTVLRCVVPRLAGKTLRQARAALRRTTCVLGRVTRPRARRGRRLGPLVVGSSSPRAGARRPAGTRVALTLKPKPRARRARRRRRRR